MAKKTNTVPLAAWAAAVGATAEETSAAWEDLLHRGLATVRGGKRTVSPFALRRANSAVQRRLAAHLSGFLLTENSFIVRRAGEPQARASILNSRIAVEHIAHYFKDGCGVTDIQRDLPQLTREEIEAAIQYYLNHRGRQKGPGPERHRAKAARHDLRNLARPCLVLSWEADDWRSILRSGY